MTPGATGSRCLGCGRTLVGDTVCCAGCGRPLEGGGDVPPGWIVSSRSATGAASSPPPAAVQQPPGASGNPFRAPAPGGDDAARPAYVLNPSWRLRPRLAPGALAANSTMPQFTALPAPPPGPPPARRAPWASALYWALVSGILGTSAAAFVILAVHIAARG